MLPSHKAADDLDGSFRAVSERPVRNRVNPAPIEESTKVNRDIKSSSEMKEVASTRPSRRLESNEKSSRTLLAALFCSVGSGLAVGTSSTRVTWKVAPPTNTMRI